MEQPVDQAVLLAIDIVVHADQQPACVGQGTTAKILCRTGLVCDDGDLVLHSLGNAKPMQTDKSVSDVVRATKVVNQPCSII